MLADSDETLQFASTPSIGSDTVLASQTIAPAASSACGEFAESRVWVSVILPMLTRRMTTRELG